MYTLDELQEMGAISKSLKTITCSSAVEIDALLAEPESSRIETSGPVVVSEYNWIATVAGAPASKSTNVYSSDGSIVGKWNRGKRTFYKMQLQGDFLATIQTFQFKEEKQMATTDLNLGDLGNLDALDEAVNASQSTQRADAFGNDTMKDQNNKSEKDKQKEEDRQRYDGIRQKLDAGFTGNIVPNDEVLRNNFLYGRLYAFITGTNDAIKVSISRRAVTTEDNKKQLMPTAPAEVQEAFANGKRVNSQWIVSERYFSFKNSKPSAAKGVIIATPTGTDLALTTIGNKSAGDYDMQNRDLAFHVMDMDTAWVYLAYNYGDKIMEADTILGARADKLLVNRTLYIGKDNKERVRPSIKPENRKSLLISGNYFPLKVYETISLQDPTPENKSAMELNVEAALSRVDQNLICAADKAHYTIGDDGSVTSDWIEGKVPLSVSRFDNSDEIITNIRLPKREKKVKENKENGKNTTYPFVYHGLDDEEQGPFAIPEYMGILKACGFSTDEFKKQVATITQRGSGKRSSKSVNKSISYENFLRGYMGHDAIVCENGKSFMDLQAVLDM